MKEQYGKKRGITVFYASKNKGTIKKLENRKQAIKMQKLDKIKEVKVADQSVEIDPRSKTTADKAFNYIGTGKPEMPVGGQKRMLAEKRKETQRRTNGLVQSAKIAMQAGAKIYSNRQKTKMAMSDAQLMHAEKMARGEEAYQGKLLEARQTDWKDEFVLLILSAPIVVLAWAVISDDPEAMDKVKLFFEYFSTLPSWFTNLWILVVASIFGIKGTQIFRNGGKK